MNKLRKIILLMVIVTFIAFLAIWLNSRQNAYAHDFWYYSWGQHVTENSGYGENGVMPGSFGDGHDLALAISRVLIVGGNFMLPAFFISFFIGSGYFMLRKLVRFPESIFLVAPFSLVLLITSGSYFLFAQMLAMGFFFLAIGFYLRDRKLPVAVCLMLMSVSHAWSAFFYLGCFGIYLLIRDRRFVLYLLPAVAIFLALMPDGMFNFLSTRTSVGSNLSYLVNVQLTENIILIPPLIYGIWILRRHKIGLLFGLIILFPLVSLAFLWSPFWSWRVVTLLPLNCFEAMGVSALLEYIARRGGV